MTNRNKSKKKKIKKEDSFIYIIILLMVTILLVAINQMYNKIGLGVIVLPIVLFINNYILKEFSSKEEKFALIVSILSITMYLFLLYNLMNMVISILTVLKEVSIFTISLIINNIVHKKIEKEKEKKYIVFNYILVMIGYLILYTIL